MIGHSEGGDVFKLPISVVIKVRLKANAQFYSIESIRRSGDEHVRTQVVTSDERRGKILREVDIESTVI